MAKFRVVIVGGGIAGLTLANALEQGDVDYVLLERRGEVAPQVGASIGLLQNGLRILDQLGAYEALQKKLARVLTNTSRHEDGTQIGAPIQVQDLSLTRTGYELIWGDRQAVLEVLRDNLRDQSKLLVNKQVQDIDHSASGVKVRCKDGSVYDGDIVVGADGVYSKVRQEMWRFAEKTLPELVRSERTAMRVEYNCLFGIVEAHPGWMQPGNIDLCLGYDRCTFIVPGQGSKFYYFAMERLDRRYTLEDAPRYTDNLKEAEAFIARHGKSLGWGHHTLAQAWERTTFSRIVPLEEGIFKLWTWGRIACVGDSIHKATPNLGAGGNAAIESAAALANEIKLMADASRRGKVTEPQIRSHLEAYQKAREVRAKGVIQLSDKVIRLQTRTTLFDRLFVKYGLAALGDYLQEMAGESTVGASKIDYLPLPLVSLRGTQPFNPSQGMGHEESKLKRALLALPFLIMSVIALNALDLTEVLPGMAASVVKGVAEIRGSSYPIIQTFYHIKGVDDLLAAINTFFFPSIYNIDPVSRTQTVSLLTDASVLVAIWYLESVRRANRLSPLQLPGIFFLLGQLMGLCIVAPIYAFLHYTLSPIELFGALDRRLTNLRYTRALPLAVLVGFVVPTYGSFFHPDANTQQIFLFVFQLFPFFVAASLALFSRLFPETMERDKIDAPKRDLPYVRFVVGSCVLISAGLWVATVLFGPYSFRELFVPTALPKDTPADIVEVARQFLRIDEIGIFGSALLWLGYLFGDLKKAGMVEVGWVRLVVYTVGSVLALGPGATVGLGWLWREEILATRTHKDARTVESLAGLGEKAGQEKKPVGKGRKYV